MARTSFVDVALRLRGARRFNAEVAAATKQLEAMGVKGAASMGAFAQKADRLKSAGRSLTMGLTLPIVGVGAVAGKMAIDFSEAMNQVQTQAAVGAGEVRQMEESILNYAESGLSSAGPEELAKGMYRIASAGLRGKDAIEALTRAEELATVGRVDMEVASSALASAVQTGIKGTENYEAAIGVLNATVGAGNMRMEDLVAAMGTGVVSAAKVSGLSFDQLGASIALLTSKGQPAQASATRLAMTFGALSAPTDKAAEAMGRLGLAPLELARMLQRGQFPQALATLRERLDGFSKVEQGQLISDMFGGGRSSRAILTILDDLDGFDAKLKQIQKEGGNFGDLLASVMNEPKTKWDRALAQMSATMIRLGNAIGPMAATVLKDLGAAVTFIARAFSALPKPLRIIIGGFVLLAAVVGPVVWIVGVFAKAVGGLLIILPKLIAISKALALRIALLNVVMWANPVLLVVAGIVALIAILAVAYFKIGWFRDAVDAAFSWMKGAVSWLGKAFANAFRWIVTAIGNAVGWIRANWKTIVPILLGPVGIITALIIKNFDSIVSFIRSVPGKIASAASGMWNGVKEAFRSAINFIIDGWNALDLSLTIPVVNRTVSIGTPNIPRLAEGGTATRSGTVMVGERGPELLSLPRAASVIPLDRTMGPGRIEVPVYLNGRQIALAVAGEVSDAKARS